VRVELVEQHAPQKSAERVYLLVVAGAAFVTMIGVILLESQLGGSLNALVALLGASHQFTAAT
jgi:hypothetical protein